MIIQENKDIKRLVKRAAAAQDFTLAALARKIDKLPQELNNTLTKKHVAVEDLLPIAYALQCDIDISFLPRPATDQQQRQE